MKRFFWSIILLASMATVVSFTNKKNGSVGDKAQDWQIKGWIDGDGKSTDHITVSDFEGKVVYLKLFKYGCPGCHSVGFPNLQAVHNEFGEDSSVQLLGIQTAFSGKGYNNFEKLKIVQEDYNLPIPFGHDPGATDAEYPDVMVKYQTRGTPWVIIIDKKGIVRYSDFKIDSNRAIAMIKKLKEEE